MEVVQEIISGLKTRRESGIKRELLIYACAMEISQNKVLNTKTDDHYIGIECCMVRPANIRKFNAAKRLLAIIVLAYASLQLILYATVVVYELLGHQGILEFELLLPGCVGLIISLTILFWGINVVVRRWRIEKNNELFLCPNCGYDMRGSYAKQRTQCPECGYSCHRPTNWDSFDSKC